MTQPTQRLDLSLTANSNTPKWDSLWPLGNRLASQLKPGHFVTQQYAMEAVHPRPDSETGNYAGTVIARHRWAYFDNTTPVTYEIPIKVFGGSAPHMYTLLSAPAGATIGEGYDGTGVTHGIVSWVPSTSFSTSTPATFSVKVTGQDGNSITIDWTVATSSSTNQFIFISNSGNDSTGTGTISAPFATLSKIIGANSSSTTYPGRIVYLRGGSYSTVPHSDLGSPAWRFYLDPAKIPSSWISFPTESVSISFSGGECGLAGTGSDISIYGSSTAQMTISGSSTDAPETHNISLADNSKRVSLAFINFDGFIPRVNGGFENSCPIFAPGSNETPTRQYISLHKVAEVNRTVTSANDCMLHSFFGTQYVVAEYCSGTRSGGPGPGFKDTCFNTSTRYANYQTDNENFGFAFMCQNGSGDQEICYSKVRGKLWFNLQGGPTLKVLKHCEYRNTVYAFDTNFAEGVIAIAGTGPYTSINSAVISSIAPHISALITASGTECQSTKTSPNQPFNTTTLLLQNVSGQTQWRDLYLGTRGSEIQ